ncbi:hypothetical protein C1E24_12220 [Pseudoalteromonas phenolica]|uniref:Uncharacterized protein n=1 Tax=Pseudoalteromonas phenolica TaxID=161398 RepID=A0A5R9Q1F6_9GAMM|nr:hypothetical protein [Pseudoalteromonas phenolica]TLX46765.1 hypothetical protein C1E24_12220 [Pseudoalteromonas phenolica]
MKSVTLVRISCIIVSLAFIDAIGALFSFWSIEGHERGIILTIESVVLIALLFNSLLIKRWVIGNTNDKTLIKIAWLNFLSLCFCLLGDITNFNLPETFYRYESIIKHDYLADSIYFFLPGYTLLLLAGIRAIELNTKDKHFIRYPVIAGCVVGMISMAMMHLPNTDLFITISTGIYAMLIGVVGFTGFAFIVSCGGFKASKGELLVGMGFILAAVADAIIGNFWIYGHQGEGFYPQVRYINWIVYITSQCMVIHLPHLLVINSKYSHDKNQQDYNPVT